MNKLFFLSVILVSSHAMAQVKGEIKGDDITVIKDYKPLLADAVKYQQQATLPKPDTLKMKMKYSLSPNLLSLAFVPAYLKPVAMTKQDDATVLQNNYIKVGFGSQLSPYADAHFSNGRNDKIYYSVNAFHNSGHSTKVDFKNFADNLFTGDVRLQFKKATLGITAGYKSNGIYYYGFQHNDSLLDLVSKDMLKQRYSSINGGLWLQNAAPTKHFIDYKFSVNEKYFSDIKKNNENEIEGSFLFSKGFMAVHRVSLSIGVDAISFKDTLGTGNFTLIPIHPYYEFRKGKYYARGGFNVIPGDKTLFYPDIYGEARFAKNQVITYINFGGMVDKNIAMNLTAINPFLNPNMNREVGKSMVISGGIKGSLGDYFVYAAEVGYRFYDFLPMYLIDTNFITRYEISYEEAAGEFNPHVELGFRKGNKIALTLKGDYYKYDLDFDNPAYGYPDWKITLNANYNIQDKILVNFDLFSNSGVKEKFTTERRILRSTNNWIDANLSIIYNYKKNFGAFLMFNNIGATTYYPWYKYDTYGFGFKGGIIVKF